jgi:hypothetical protein
VTQAGADGYPTSQGRKRILIGQLGSFGDCLYATTVARQIKKDYPDCHLTWAIGSRYNSILKGNPHIDAIWEFPLAAEDDMTLRWQQFEKEAIERRDKGDFDEVFFTQIFPNNFRNYDGTVRSSIFRGYNRPITVPVEPVIRLSDSEVQSVRLFADSNALNNKKQVILFECSHRSGQSFVTLEFAQEVSKMIIETHPDCSIILSSNEPFLSTDSRIIDGSVLSFRENAELSKYCTLLVGCSSGISWLCTSDWAKPLPMIQLLKKGTGVYASFVNDHEYQGISCDSIIEMTDCSTDKLYECIHTILTDNFTVARRKYHQRGRISFGQYGYVLAMLFYTGKYEDLQISLKHTINRFGFRPQIFSGLVLGIIKYPLLLFYKSYVKKNYR